MACIISDNDGNDGDKTYARLGFKGETKINDQLTGCGQWEYNFQVTTLKALMLSQVTKPSGIRRPEICGDAGSFDTVVTGLVYDANRSPICCLSSVVIPAWITFFLWSYRWSHDLPYSSFFGTVDGLNWRSVIKAK